ncbi:Hypothetical predicted protein [Olea europaea subsp. europaea]|uniref:Uncharacterized protein n=1 Tax=Olea europaea subsp. europaea TaxID=158383 RepID=A0A8S0VDC6_OLEEU|nr:Hypothetical predicted protein [Olea europaea subsp. europaea]
MVAVVAEWGGEVIGTTTYFFARDSILRDFLSICLGILPKHTLSAPDDADDSYSISAPEHQGNDTAWVWHAVDFADGELQ